MEGDAATFRSADQPLRSERANTSQFGAERRALARSQREVVLMIAVGEPDKRIAVLLCIFERCVRFHIHGYLERTYTQTRAHALASKPLAW